MSSIVTNYDKRGFEYEGSLDTMAGHCRNFGIDYDKAKNAKYQYGLSAIESLDFARVEVKKPLPVLPYFFCDICKQKTKLNDESLLAGKCIKCYSFDALMFR